MAVTRKLQFEELDSQSREYLLSVRDRMGIGMPGIFVPRRNDWPAIAFASGVLVLGLTAFASWKLMVEEPLGIAMLEMAGALLGGWLMLYAFRVNLMRGSDHYPGHFIYADAETLWECSGTTVRTTSLSLLEGAKQQKVFTSEGKYAHTTVTVRASGSSRKLDIAKRSLALDLTAYFNALAWLQEGNGGLAKAPPAVLAGAAIELAHNDTMPADLSPEALGLEVVDVPEPQRDNRAAFGVLNLLLIVGFAAGGVLTLKSLNAGWRDQAIWAEVQDIEDKDSRAPWLRAYIADERNMAHRDEAKAMLASIYKDTIDRIRNGSIQRQRYGEVKLSAPVNASIDPGLFAGLSELLLDLGKQPVPVISVSAHEKLRKGIEPGAGTPEQRERALVEAYTLAVRDGVGKELVEFALAPPEAGAMIEVEYEPAPAAAGWRYLVTVKFRLETDGNVIKTVRKSIANPLGPETSMRAVGAQLGVLTAGSKKLELQVLEE